MKNALLPEFDRRGSRGTENRSTDHQALKRGRPSNIARHTGVATGVDIDETIKEYFRRGTKLFYENAEKVSRIEAFERILALFFHCGKELRNGVFVPLLPPADELPTLSQYRYWYRKGPDVARSDASRKGSPASDAGKGAVLGPLRQTIPSPGCQFEIHVVIGDIYLVSTLDRRRILGRPVINIVVDVFSDLIVGVSVSLEGPSRQGAMLALENMAHDKVAYCREYGVEITEDAWPSHHLPKAILADRSELLLENADILVNALAISISNTQPCRSGWRKSFEHCFPLLDETAIHWVPDSASSPSEAGRKVHRLDGCLTLHEFRRLVIECIIEHNLAHRLSDDNLDGDMIADCVEPYPRDVWTWGLQNRFGALRMLPIDDVRRHYRIYLRSQGSQPLETRKLLEEDEAEFEGCDWFDIEDLVARNMNRAATERRNRQRRVELPSLRDRILEEARHEAS
jgi:putative transposase